ncbi:MAG: 3-hydroxyacyl-CoA dehydrogenase NAD-binding domain-containing protein, partial [Spirochaetales bacterium]|nr:3-hydroxyacyl-CoA dehydrogenase NAD-binding domain-containing protein [Spirochaetales bacterium]
MGCGIAQLFAYAGHQVTVTDVSEEALSTVHSKIKGNLERMMEQVLADSSKIELTLDSGTPTSDFNSSVAGAYFVVEAVSENLGLKQKIFQQLDALCPPETILASNTSVISIT